MPHLMEWSVLIMEAMPEVSMALPMLVFMLHSCSISASSDSAPSRKARPQEAASTASAMKRPEPWHSTTSTSRAMMPLLRQASTSTACSAGPLGALMPALLPLFWVAPPTSVPTEGTSSLASASIFSWHFTTTVPTPSDLTWPWALESKVKQRPPGHRKPAALCAGHQAFARQRCTPMPQDASWICPWPFFSTDSAAQNTADSPEAASVSIAKLAPLQPRQKLKRPAVILGAPPVAPKMPTSAAFSAKFHSL
mmetsp:Transcript_48392/g.115278  ORF Transcript_48392/g.115278 Transcript_48392/m.115278 type:complete len:252 (+) Transcript_48392:1114-1869(+)